MKSRKKPIRESDTDKALARPGEIPHPKTDPERSSNVPVDPITAEKDEVKIAEEKLRKRQKDKNPKKPNT